MRALLTQLPLVAKLPLLFDLKDKSSRAVMRFCICNPQGAIMARALAYSLCLFVWCLGSDVSSAPRESVTPEATLAADRPVLLAQRTQITMSMYERIATRMTYEEVLRILGSPGQELSRSDLAGITTVMYMWQNRDGSNMNVMLQNGRVVQKAQFGLK